MSREQGYVVAGLFPINRTEFVLRSEPNTVEEISQPFFKIFFLLLDVSVAQVIFNKPFENGINCRLLTALKAFF